MNIALIFPKDSKEFYCPSSEGTFGGATVFMHYLACSLTSSLPKSRFFAFLSGVQKNPFQNTNISLLSLSEKTSLFRQIIFFIRELKSKKIHFVVQHGLSFFSFPLFLVCRILGIYYLFIFASDSEVNGLYQETGKKCFFFRFFIKQVNFLFCLTAFQQNEIKKKWQRDASIFRIGVKSIPSRQSLTKSIKGYVLWVGRGVPCKQPELYLSLARDFPHVHFVMIMPKQDSFSFFYAQIAKQASQIHNLECIQKVTWEDSWKYFRNASFLINTSLYEGFSYTFLQGSASGTPILSLFSNPDGILNRFSIGYCADGDMEKLKSFFREISENEQLWKSLSQNALTYIKNHHNLDNEAKKMALFLTKMSVNL